MAYAISTPYSREHKAALLGVEMAAIRKKTGQWSLNFPNRFAPLSVDQSIQRVRAPQGIDPDVGAFVARRRCCAILAGNGMLDAVWRQGMTPKEQTEFVKSNGAADRGRCRYCDVTNALNACNGSHSQVSSLKKVAVPSAEHARGRIVPNFDTDTFVTKVEVTDHRISCSPDMAPLLLDAADPRNWKAYGGDFFVNSDPGRWEAGRWNEGPWDQDDGGDLYEVTQMELNDQVSVEVHNILSISNFQKDATHISYEYSLRHCIKSNLGLVWEYGGLDLDNGAYSAVVTDLSTEKVVAINASKSVRYTRPRANPALGTFYNMVAPAFVSLLMRDLVYESVDRINRAQIRGAALPRPTSIVPILNGGNVERTGHVTEVL